MLSRNKVAAVNLRTSIRPCQAEASIYKNLNLLRELVRRDFNARFTGSALGVAWAVRQPLSLVVLYWFVFTYMFTRGPGTTSSGYINFLISGLIPWLAI